MDLDRRRRRVGAVQGRRTSPPSRCAISWCIRAITISSIATHGRGIWIVDDITPLRSLAGDVLAWRQPSLRAGPCSSGSRAPAGGRAATRASAATIPTSGAVITYYQRTRHIFGKISLQVLDANGAVVDTIPASARRGINRVTWSMRVKPPEVPPAAQLAQAGFNGPRVLPGVYTVRLTKGDKTFETTLPVALDRRATFTEGDRKAQYDAAMRVHALFGSMTALVRRINAVREAADRELASLPKADPARRPVEALALKVDGVRKRVVATTEGGAITGEERLREHADQLFNAILLVRGPPRRLPGGAHRRAARRARRHRHGLSGDAQDRAGGRQCGVEEEEAAAHRGTVAGGRTSPHTISATSANTSSARARAAWSVAASATTRTIGSVLDPRTWNQASPSNTFTPSRRSIGCSR